MLTKKNTYNIIYKNDLKKKTKQSSKTFHLI